MPVAVRLNVLLKLLAAVRRSAAWVARSALVAFVAKVAFVVRVVSVTPVVAPVRRTAAVSPLWPIAVALRLRLPRRKPLPLPTLRPPMPRLQKPRLRKLPLPTPLRPCSSSQLREQPASFRHICLAERSGNNARTQSDKRVLPCWNWLEGERKLETGYLRIPGLSFFCNRFERTHACQPMPHLPSPTRN